MAATALSTIYNDVAARLGTMQLSITNLLPVGPDPGRWLLSQQLRSDGEGPVWMDAWAYLPSIPTLGFRVIAEFPHIGGAMLDQLTGNGLAASTNFTLTKPLPILTTHGITGLIPLAQQACREVSYEDTLDLTPAANVYTVDLSAQQAWLTEERVCRLADGSPAFYDPPTVTGYPNQPAPDRYGEIMFAQGVPTLRLQRAYDQSLDALHPAQLCVIRPAYSLVSGAESASGPSTDAQTVGGEQEELVMVTLLHCYRYLAGAQHISAEERQRYAGLVAPQLDWVRSNVKHWLPRDEMAGKAAA